MAERLRALRDDAQASLQGVQPRSFLDPGLQSSLMTRDISLRSATPLLNFANPRDKRAKMPSPFAMTQLPAYLETWQARSTRRFGFCAGLTAGVEFRAPQIIIVQTTVPNSLPIPAVMANAKAPQNVTRTVARRTFAPPALAPTAPRSARNTRDAAETIGISASAGDMAAMSNGMAAPVENMTADVRAACTGRVVVISDIPSSSRAWVPKASFAISC